MENQPTNRLYLSDVSHLNLSNLVTDPAFAARLEQEELSLKQDEDSGYYIEYTNTPRQMIYYTLEQIVARVNRGGQI